MCAAFIGQLSSGAMKPNWQPVASAPPAIAQHIHIWKADLGEHAALAARLQPVLSSDEVARAQRFLVERTRNRYIAARGILRTLLGGYLAIAPTEVRFAYRTFGKPVLAHPPAPLEFNVSHSSELVAFVFADSRRVGIDIERVRHDFDFAGVAETVFSTAERAQLESGVEQPQFAFFRLWTQKEAFVKAVGCGLAYAVPELDVARLPGADAMRSLLTTHEIAPGTLWSIGNWNIDSDYMMSLVHEGDKQDVHFWNWPP
jgi:4'-phosphopantetheinyl transferase